MEFQGEQSVQEVALNNPIILTEILQQSATPLKACRLVSHFWNEIVLSLPNTRLSLKLYNKQENNNEDCLVPFFELCSALDSRLARRVSAKTPPRYEARYPFAANLMHLCDKFGHRVRILRIFIRYEACLPSVFQVLKNSCPNLKEFRVWCKFYVEFGQRSGEIVLTRLPQNLNLTVFQLRSDIVTASPALTWFTQLVVNAAPNLRVVTLPWGIYPDLEYLKFLDSLTIVLDHRRPLDVALRQFRPSELTRMLNQVGYQLVYLAFSYRYLKDRFSMRQTYDLDNWITTPSEFRLPEKMSKLESFRNEMLDIIRHADLWRDIERMPALGYLRIGKISKKGKSVDAILKNLSKRGRIYEKVKELWINELYNPRLLKEVKTAFPAVQILGLDTFHETKVGGMKLGVVLKACTGWDKLHSLDLCLPSYPDRMWDFMSALSNARELFKVLKSLEIKTHDHNRIQDLTAGQMFVFKGLLVEMKDMDEVIIKDLYFDAESQRNILAFIASNGMPESKFNLFEERRTE